MNAFSCCKNETSKSFAEDCYFFLKHSRLCQNYFTVIFMLLLQDDKGV